MSRDVVAQTLHEVDSVNLKISEDSIGLIQYLSHQSGCMISKREVNVRGDEYASMRSMKSRKDTRWL